MKYTFTRRTISACLLRMDLRKLPANDVEEHEVVGEGHVL